METYLRFLFEFLNQFFSGFKEIFTGLWNGIKKICNIGEYTEIIQYYKNDFSIPEWILVAVAIIAVVFVVAAVIALILLAARLSTLHNLGYCLKSVKRQHSTNPTPHLKSVP